MFATNLQKFFIKAIRRKKI